MSTSDNNRDNNGGEAIQSFSGKGGSMVKFKLADWTDLNSFSKVKHDPAKFEAWLLSLESRAEIYKYDDDATLRVLLLKLDEDTRAIVGSNSSLEEAKKLLLETYGHPQRDPMTAFQDLLNIRQEDGESITDYFLRHKKGSRECERLKYKVHQPEDIFFRGLHVDHQRILVQRQDRSVADMMRACRLHESMGYVSAPRKVSNSYHHARPVFAAEAKHQEEQHTQQQQQRFQQQQLQEQREFQKQQQQQQQNFQQQQMAVMKGMVDSMQVMITQLQGGALPRRGGANRGRPGQCWDFATKGFCKFGETCKFTHRVDDEKKYE